MLACSAAALELVVVVIAPEVDVTELVAVDTDVE